jgi:hypothetical protein
MALPSNLAEYDDTNRRTERRHLRYTRKKAVQFGECLNELTWRVQMNLRRIIAGISL